MQHYIALTHDAALLSRVIVIFNSPILNSLSATTPEMRLKSDGTAKALCISMSTLRFSPETHAMPLPYKPWRWKHAQESQIKELTTGTHFSSRRSPTAHFLKVRHLAVKVGKRKILKFDTKVSLLLPDLAPLMFSRRDAKQKFCNFV